MILKMMTVWILTSSYFVKWLGYVGLSASQGKEKEKEEKESVAHSQQTTGLKPPSTRGLAPSLPLIWPGRKARHNGEIGSMKAGGPQGTRPGILASILHSTKTARRKVRAKIKEKAKEKVRTKGKRREEKEKEKANTE